MAVLTQIGNKDSLEERAYKEIKQAIITNRLKPGQILTEEALANEMAVSRTPVRSALKRLEYERLIRMGGARTMEVAALQEKDVADLSAVRIALEPLACQLAAQTATSKQIEHLWELYRRQSKALDVLELEKYIQLEFEWNSAIAHITDNRWLIEMIQQLETMVCRVLILSGHLDKYGPLALQEHRAVLQAIEQHNPELAKQQMQKHLNGVCGRINPVFV